MKLVHKVSCVTDNWQFNQSDWFWNQVQRHRL